MGEQADSSATPASVNDRDLGRPWSRIVGAVDTAASDAIVFFAPAAITFPVARWVLSLPPEISAHGRIVDASVSAVSMSGALLFMDYCVSLIVASLTEPIVYIPWLAVIVSCLTFAHRMAPNAETYRFLVFHAIVNAIMILLVSGGCAAGLTIIAWAADISVRNGWNGWLLLYVTLGLLVSGAWISRKLLVARRAALVVARDAQSARRR